MKKCFLLPLLVLFVLPVSATTWEQIDTKRYIDLDSIEKYNDKYDSRKSEIYSFWIKSLNDESQYFTDFEKDYNKKVWYTMTRNLINCDNKTITPKAIIFYDLSHRVIKNFELPAYSLEWHSIIPDSIGEDYYYGICKPE